MSDVSSPARALKAGLPLTFWLTGKAKILRFTAQIFRERRPGGEVVEEELKPLSGL